MDERRRNLRLLRPFGLREPLRGGGDDAFGSEERTMLGSRLFHSVIIVGAALAAGAGIGCSAGDGAPSPAPTSTTGSDTRSTDPASDADGGAATDADAGRLDSDAGTDPGWHPTK